jgi:hypothetical protein
MTYIDVFPILKLSSHVLSLSLSLCDLMCFRFFSGHVSGAVTKTQQVAAMHSRTLGPLLAVQLRQF